MDVIKMYDVHIYKPNGLHVDLKHIYTVKTIEEALQLIYDYKDFITQNASIEIIKKLDVVYDTLKKDVKNDVI